MDEADRQRPQDRAAPDDPADAPDGDSPPPAGEPPDADPPRPSSDPSPTAAAPPSDPPPPVAAPQIPVTPPADAPDPVPPWLRASASIAGRLLVVVVAIALSIYVLAYLRVVVLPIIVALLVSTVLRPPTRWLTRHRFSDAAAATTTLFAALAALAGALTLAGAAIGRQFSDLADSVQDGVREAGNALAEPPFNLSKADINDRIDSMVDRLSESSGELTGGAVEGAVLVGEVLTGMVIAVLLLFFFLKDGPGLWRWLVQSFGGRQRARMDDLGRRSYAALSGYVRGLVLVGLADATMIGAGLAILGVPLVFPLMLLTFLAAFVPLIGAFAAGLAAVLIALVSGGVITALIVFGLVVAVQQVEGHLLYPIIMGRTVHIHPIAVILALAVGGIIAGIPGVFVSVPLVTVAATALTFARETREQPAPASRSS
ncbi:MAG: AI-2E family transporter [Solirubrobacteraceae bacterium]